ncbi:DnaJ-like protein subfamily C member 10 [Aphelenchoides besseyi]|nr:DnaJ-like protein subfamily C member 10 [Aphelenchoides besseyi]KAI6208391.1 DnaJ-like protein subfamily C member 10 [Aphelenchoides besseyi]
MNSAGFALDTDFIGMTILALIWGFTNPWMANASRKQTKKSGSTSTKVNWLLRPIHDLICIFRNWRFIVPFIINQSASLFFLKFVIESDLSKAVCTVNSLTLFFTALFGRLFFNEQMNISRLFLGSIFVFSGLYLIRTAMSWSTTLTSFVFIVQFIFLICLAADDFYELLGVSRDADDRTIRRAFKKLAIQKHPDRDSNNPNAHADFIRINKAYEVLKDAELRRRYDHGEDLSDDSKHSGQNYQSWSFYNEKFGIYDEDMEIVTLTPSEFQSQVVDSNDFWFVNFYSTFCSHCHVLAPVWREFARKMHGIVRIGAVNCAEYPQICHGEQVNAYPSLLVYPEHVFYQGRREVDALVEFITSRLPVEIIHITHRNIESLTTQWEPYAQRPWLIDFCDEMENCFTQTNRRLLAHMLNGIVNVGTIICTAEGKEKLCDTLRSDGVAFYPTGKMDKAHEIEIGSIDIKEVHAKVLQLIPPIDELSDSDYRNLLDTIEETRKEELLILFTDSNSKQGFQNGELKKLSVSLTNVKFLLADCSVFPDECEGLHFGHLPRLVFFRANGNFIISYDKKITLNEARAFVASARKSTIISLNEQQFTEILQQQADGSSTDLWLIDHFAPWCRPCLNLLAELNKLPHTLDGRRLRTGIIDCDVHKQFCSNQGVNNYPTTFFLFGQNTERMIGFHNSENVIDFIRESLNPSVAILGSAEFDELVVNKPPEEIFVIDFFAPWCGPCQQLAPEYRKVARIVQEETDLISFGSVDCEAHRELCRQNNIRSYPTIRVFANGRHFDYPANWWRDHGSIRQWLLQFLPTNVENADENRLNELLEVETKLAVMVDYFAPWCGFCQQLAPIYDQASRMMEGRVHFVKVDCVEQPNACTRAGISAYPTIKLYTPGKRSSAGGIRLQVHDAKHLVDVANRILGEYGHHRRDEL